MPCSYFIILVTITFLLSWLGFPLALLEEQHAFDTQSYVYYLRSQSDWTETSLYEAEFMNEWVEKLRKKA